MSILHVTTGANYNVTKAYIRFINENFDSNNHIFLVLDNIQNIPDDLKNVSNVINLDRNEYKFKHKFFNYIKGAKLVLLHSLSWDIFSLIYCLINPKLMKKLVWVSWGMDLYQWRSTQNGFHYKVRNLIAYKFRQKIEHFVGIFPPDIDFFKKEFKSNAKTFYASYTGNLYNPLYSKDKVFNKLEDKVKSDEFINIQIGHSSTRVLNHVEVLKSLEKFKDKNIRIFLPLSYGDTKYGDFVEEKAKKLFGDKAICLREMMPKDDYMNYISKMDIVIFNTYRQIGLGNIGPMLYMEKKIFMPKGSVMYDFYKSQQVDIWDYNEIANFDYNEFIQPVRFKGGRKYIVDNELNLEHKIDMWNKVFEAPLKRGI